MKLTRFQLVYSMEIATKNAHAYSMEPIELEEEITYGEDDGKGTKRNPEK